MRDLVTWYGFGAGEFITEPNEAHTESVESRALCAVCDLHTCSVPVPRSIITVMTNPELTSQSQQYFICRQSVWIYRFRLGNDYLWICNTKRKPRVSWRDLIWFRSWKSVEQQLYVVLLVSRYLLTLFQKSFVLYLWEGKIMIWDFYRLWRLVIYEKQRNVYFCFFVPS